MPSRLMSPALAGFAAALLLSAPLAAGWAGAAARAAEPAVEPEPAPIASPASAQSDAPAADASPSVEATSAPEPAEPATSAPSAEPAEPTVLTGPAPAVEPATTPSALPEEKATEKQQSAAASAPEAVAVPVAMMTEEAARVDEALTFVGDDGCVYTYSEEEGLIVILDIAGCAAVVVPAEIDGLPVQIIGSLAAPHTITGAASFTSLVLPDSLVAIGVSAFKNAEALVTLDLGAGVQRISANAFQDSDALASVTLPASVEEVGDRAFEKAGALASIDLGEVQTVGKLAFSGAGQVTELRVPQSVTNAEDTAFGNMPHLRSLLIEANPSALEKFTFLNSTSLELVEFHSRSSTARVASTMFQGSAPSSVYFRDGAFGLDCDAEPFTLGGMAADPFCLYDATIDHGAPLFAVIRNVREGAVIEDLPEVVPPDGKQFDGFVPAIEDGVHADTHYVAQFVSIVPDPYTPSEDELVDSAQGGFQVPGSVTAGDVITILPDVVNEPNPDGTLEPNPGGTSEPTVQRTGEPEPTEDPNDFVDVWMFSEPVELAIIEGSTDALTVQVPADIEPGDHRIAVYTVFGELIAWQPVSVLAAEGPAAPPADGGDESAGGADGDEGAGDGQEADGGATSTGSTSTVGGSGGSEGVAGASIDQLSETGAPAFALSIAGAVALAAVGAMLIIGRRLTR